MYASRYKGWPNTTPHTDSNWEMDAATNLHASNNHRPNNINNNIDNNNNADNNNVSSVKPRRQLTQQKRAPKGARITKTDVTPLKQQNGEPKEGDNKKKVKTIGL